MPPRFRGGPAVASYQLSSGVSPPSDRLGIRVQDQGIHAVTSEAEQLLQRVRASRVQLQANGPPRTRPFEDDFQRVALPMTDGDALRDLLIADAARVVIEIGLAYGSSALAIGEALCAAGVAAASHIVVDPFQSTAYDSVGWEVLTEAGLAKHTTFYAEASSVVLPRLAAEGVVADAAFVDGSHRFHEVFVDLYFLRKLVRPRGLIVLDDVTWPSVATALSYFDRHLGWQPVEMPGRLTARRLPVQVFEPDFTDFRSF